MIYPTFHIFLSYCQIHYNLSFQHTHTHTHTHARTYIYIYIYIYMWRRSISSFLSHKHTLYVFIYIYRYVCVCVCVCVCVERVREKVRERERERVEVLHNLQRTWKYWSICSFVRYQAFHTSIWTFYTSIAITPAENKTCQSVWIGFFLCGSHFPPQFPRIVQGTPYINLCN